MAEIMTQIGVQNITAVLGVFMAFIGGCAFLTSIVTEALKSIDKLDRLPTKLLCYIVALVLTTPVFCAMMAYLNQPVEWFMVFASFLASFVVAKVSMNGWDDVTELVQRLIWK
ncbi:MAG: hypothetical protein K2M60_04030 [Lachnospiraceae bacterium]|nr:hypothetical protein [Lachnospiraceae bacterium]MDE6251145.1 hypothetical protein [Lachnospiraceae bacterium]